MARHQRMATVDEESDRLNRFIEGLSTSDRADPTQRLRFWTRDLALCSTRR